MDDASLEDKVSEIDSNANNLPGVNCRLENFEMKMHTTDMTFSELYHEIYDIVASRSRDSHVPLKSKKRSYDNILPEAIYFFNNKFNYDILSHSKAIEKGCETSTNPYEQSNGMNYNTSSSSSVYDLQSKQDKILECVVLESHLSTEANMYGFYKECTKKKL